MGSQRTYEIFIRDYFYLVSKTDKNGNIYGTTTFNKVNFVFCCNLINE